MYSVYQFHKCFWVFNLHLKQVRHCANLSNSWYIEHLQFLWNRPTHPEGVEGIIFILWMYTIQTSKHVRKSPNEGTEKNASLVAQLVNYLPAMQETQVQPLAWEDILQKRMPTPPVFLLGEFHRQGSLAGYSPWGREESDTTERFHFHFLPSRSFHKPLILLHQRADRLKTTITGN